MVNFSFWQSFSHHLSLYFTSSFENLNDMLRSRIVDFKVLSSFFDSETFFLDRLDQFLSFFKLYWHIASLCSENFLLRWLRLLLLCSGRRIFGHVICGLTLWIVHETSIAIYLISILSRIKVYYIFSEGNINIKLI